MKILIVEDKIALVESLKRAISGFSDKVEILHAASKSSAYSILNTEFLDFIILDRSIPTEDHLLDESDEFGQDVFFEAEKKSFGTPIYILTGTDDNQFIRKLVSRGQQVDLWGTGENIATVEYFLKTEVNDILLRIEQNIKKIEKTESIIINKRLEEINLNLEQERILKVYARLNDGVACNISKLGGLSGALVLAVSVIDSSGTIRANCGAKLGKVDKVDKEIAAYNKEVKNLKIGAFAHVLNYICHGLHGHSGIFYALAEDYKSTLFDVLKSDVDSANKAISIVRDSFYLWFQNTSLKTVQIKDIRKTFVSDDTFNTYVEQNNLSFLYEIEESEVMINTSCIHGDLHGGNILVNDSSSPVLIDFGDCGEGFSCLDPITLELSLIFHPDGEQLPFSGGLLTAIDNWTDLGAFTEESLINEYISFCRGWAFDVAGSDMALLAVAYSHTIKQLKYDTVAPELIIRLINNIVGRLK